MRLIALLAAGLLLAACDDRAPEQPAGVADATPPPAEQGADTRPMDLERAVAGEHRSEANRARDRFRHPQRTLAFFGLEPGMTVVELYPGTGWYTEILAPMLRDDGKLIAAQFEATAPPDYRPRIVASYREMLGGPVFENVEMVTIGDDGTMPDVADASADMVLTFRNLHNWMGAGTLDTIFAETARVLKPGGVFGVVEHRADAGAEPMASARRGYVPEAHVVERAEAAGLVLDARSEINANPADTKDYPRGVWELPPSLRGEESEREARIAIGESDRMTLRFVKPADR